MIMTHSTVPNFPLKDSSFHKTCAREATARKLGPLGYYLVVDSARRTFAAKDPSDWLWRSLIFLTLMYVGLRKIGSDYAPILGMGLIAAVSLILGGCLLGFAAHKLGLVDLACFRKKSFAEEVAASHAEVVYTHEKPGVEIVESVNVAEAAIKQEEAFAETPQDAQARMADWQTVEIKGRGKVRFHISGSTYD